jgi:hypothetical protein
MRKATYLSIFLFFISVFCLSAQRTMFAYAVNYQRLIHHHRSNELFSKVIAENLNRNGKNTNSFANGFLLQNKLNNHFFLTNGFFIGKFEFNNRDIIGKTGGNAFFFSSPLAVNYNLRLGKVDPIIGFGFNNYFALFRRSENEYSSRIFESLNPGMRRYTIAALFQAGINLMVKEKSKLRLQFEFEQHLRSVSRGSVKLNPTGLGISVGYFLLVRN